ncbi:unnamed protein product [Calypogeia fissa]
MSKLTEGNRATIKEAFRRPIWEEPNLHYDGTEPLKGWLHRLKQLRQIHGYNDKEVVHIAEKCLKGSAQVWFRIHHPKSFEALRTGLHTRFASGPILVSADAPPRASACRSGSALHSRKLVPSVVQWDVATNSSLPKRLELVAKSIVLADNGTGKQSCLPNVKSKTTHRRQESRLGSDSSTSLAQSKSNIGSSNLSRASVRSTSKNCLSGVGSTGRQKVGANRSTENGEGSQDSKVFEAKIDSKSRFDIPTAALSSYARDGDNQGTKGMDTTSVSLSSVSRRISARDVLGEDGSESLPVSCKTLPINWREALLKFKHAIHLAMQGDWTHMSSDFCKYYLRCYRMRTSGSKRELIHRIRDHLELADGSGAHKYPRSSFVVDCAGVVCLGDVILFEQKLRAGFDVLNGNQVDNSIRTVAGRVVKDCTSASSHQQVFTVEVYWSKGPETFRPMRPLYITARDLFSLHPLRQRWINEDARRGLLDEKRNFTLEQKANHGLKVAPP